MQIFQDFKQVPGGSFTRLVCGAFCQLQKNCLTRLSNTVAETPPNELLIINVYPEDAISRVLLSAEEVSTLLEQLGAKNFLTIPLSALNDFLHSAVFRPLPKDDVQNAFITFLCGLSKTGIDSGPVDRFIQNSFGTTSAFAWHENLGYYYPLSGSVVHGNQVGRTLGFPTANLKPFETAKIIPPMGVYSGWVQHGNNWYKSMINIGIRPTLDLKNVTIEAHLFDFTGDLYDKEISIHFHSRIRSEMRFPSLTALSKQLALDRTSALITLRQSNIEPLHENFLLT